MKTYKITRGQRVGENYETMTIIDRETDKEIAEYRLTNGEEHQEIAGMRRTIDAHLNNGGTLGNYQW
jgi:hypothetical protein